MAHCLKCSFMFWLSMATRGGFVLGTHPRYVRSTVWAWRALVRGNNRGDLMGIAAGCDQ